MLEVLPGIIIALGVSPEAGVAYPTGAWLSVLLSAGFSEYVGIAIGPIAASCYAVRGWLSTGS